MYIVSYDQNCTCNVYCSTHDICNNDDASANLEA